jgi:thiol-disulfide isomerase/thioredoxin
MELNFIYGMAAVMVVTGLGFIYLLIGRKKPHRPANAMEWLGTGISVILILCASLLALMGYRMQPPDPEQVARGPSELEDFAVEAPASNFAFRLVSDDSESDLEAYRGKVVILNFWGTWCAPCLVEIPELNRFYKDFKDRGVVVLSISDEPRELLQTFDEFQLPLETVSAYKTDPSLPDAFERGFDIRPTTFIIDREGTIRRYLLGPRNYGFWERAVAPYL